MLYLILVLFLNDYNVNQDFFTFAKEDNNQYYQSIDTVI